MCLLVQCYIELNQYFLPTRSCTNVSIVRHTRLIAGWSQKHSSDVAFSALCYSYCFVFLACLPLKSVLPVNRTPFAGSPTSEGVFQPFILYIPNARPRMYIQTFYLAISFSRFGSPAVRTPTDCQLYPVCLACCQWQLCTHNEHDGSAHHINTSVSSIQPPLYSSHLKLSETVERDNMPWVAGIKARR